MTRLLKDLFLWILLHLPRFLLPLERLIKALAHLQWLREQGEAAFRYSYPLHSSDLVLDVDVPRDELQRRLSGRRVCPTCQATYHVISNPPRSDARCDQDGTTLIQREDDKEAAVRRRLIEYDERTAPVLEDYRSRALLHRVDGHQGIDRVFAELRAIVERRV